MQRCLPAWHRASVGDIAAFIIIPSSLPSNISNKLLLCAGAVPGAKNAALSKQIDSKPDLQYGV